MELQISQELSFILRLLQQNPDSSCTKVIALPPELDLDSPLECFGSMVFNGNDTIHTNPCHIKSTVNCSETHILIGEVSKLQSDKDYFENFKTIAVKHKLMNIFPA